MGTKLLVTNLPLDLDSSDLEDMFTMVGDVRAALVLRDEQSDVSRGVGQVEMMELLFLMAK
jgi:RNA recognition motif-containing protein